MDQLLFGPAPRTTAGWMPMSSSSDGLGPSPGDDGLRTDVARPAAGGRPSCVDRCRRRVQNPITGARLGVAGSDENAVRRWIMDFRG